MQFFVIKNYLAVSTALVGFVMAFILPLIRRFLIWYSLREKSVFRSFHQQGSAANVSSTGQEQTMENKQDTPDINALKEEKIGAEELHKETPIVTPILEEKFIIEQQEPLKDKMEPIEIAA